MNTSTMDLTPYTAKSFPGEWDSLLQQTPVKGIDRLQTLGVIHVCPATEEFLYQPPRPIRYRRGARPVLEKIAANLNGADSAMHWVYAHVGHPHVTGVLAPDRALSEEDLITSGRGWCNEQSRVFIALCEVQEIPARLCMLFHASGRSGHVATEVWNGKKWIFYDVTFDLTVPGFEGRDLSGKHRDRAHAAYRPLFEKHYQKMLPEFDNDGGWGLKNRPKADRAGDMLDTLGICYYWIDGVEVA